MAKKKTSSNNTLWGRAKPIYDELINEGFDKNTVLGILGNMAVESSFNHRATSPSGKYTGYLQNSADISNYIKKYYGGYGHKEQMQFIKDGLRGRLKGQKTSTGAMLQGRFNNYTKAMNTGKYDAGQAADLWDKYYEISSAGRAQRISNAAKFDKILGGKGTSIDLSRISQNRRMDRFSPIRFSNDKTRVVARPNLNTKRYTPQPSVSRPSSGFFNNLFSSPLFSSISNYDSMQPSYTPSINNTAYSSPFLGPSSPNLGFYNLNLGDYLNNG